MFVMYDWTTFTVFILNSFEWLLIEIEGAYIVPRNILITDGGDMTEILLKDMQLIVVVT